MFVKIANVVLKELLQKPKSVLLSNVTLLGPTIMDNNYTHSMHQLVLQRGNVVVSQQMITLMNKLSILLTDFTSSMVLDYPDGSRLN